MAEDKQEIKETSKVIYNDTLYEQIYDPKMRTSYYLGWDSKEEETRIVDFIEDGKTKYLPIHDELLEKGAVTLPNEAIEYNSIFTLCTDYICHKTPFHLFYSIKPQV
jgi:hypothetical protein